MPNNTLSSQPIVGAFLPPRAALRNTPLSGLSDVHDGPVAISNPSQGIAFQTWQVRADGVNIYLSAPNTPEFVYLPNTAAIWVALAFDQNGNTFIAWTQDLAGQSFYRWFDTTIPGYRVSTLTGPVLRVFATLDDQRPIEFQNDDIIFAYTRLGTLFYRQQRDRFGIEYNLGAAPGALVQLGMSHVLRLQYAFQNTTGNAGIPPKEYSMPPGVNPPS